MLSGQEEASVANEQKIDTKRNLNDTQKLKAKL